MQEEVESTGRLLHPSYLLCVLLRRSVRHDNMSFSLRVRVGLPKRALVENKEEFAGLSDDALVLRFRATRDNRHFTALYQRYVRELFLRVSGVLRDHRAQATDLTQETFLKAYANIDSYRGGDFRAWLFRIGRNECVNYLRSARVRREVITDELPDWVTPQDARDDSESYSMETLSAINRLSAPQRICLKLWSEGYRFEEIAQLTNLPAGAVRSHIQNGKLRFGVLWKRERGLEGTRT
jgi:RNA polymerase sigma-70 factor, ECF subfamily